MPMPSQYRLYALVPVLALLISCTSNNEEQSVEPKSADVPFHKSTSLDSCLIIGHRVTDYDTWKAAYDLAEPVRKKHGISTRMVMQGYESQELAMVFTKISGVDRAKEYVTSEKLMKSMEIAGVQGEIDLYWLKHHLEADNPSKRECVVYMSFLVRDFAAWKEAFLGDYEEDPVKDFDVLHVFQSIENENEVSMIFAADSPEFVEAMKANTSFRMKMLASGVVSYPTTFLLREQAI